MKKTIAVIMAHADDIELSVAGGTLAKYIANGYQGLYGVLSRCNSGWEVGETGGHYVPSLNIIPKRHAEAVAAARVFGAELYHADLLENCYTRKDGAYLTASFTGPAVVDDDVPRGVPMFVAAGAHGGNTSAAIQEVADLLVKWEPELVIGQPIQNGNPDHFAAAMIVAKAWVLAAKKAKIGPYWMSLSRASLPTATEKEFPPLVATHHVDVTGYEETCLKAERCHTCQGGYLPTRAKYMWQYWSEWGRHFGCKSAEAFVQVYP